MISLLGGICALIALAAGAVLSGNAILLFLAAAFLIAALFSLIALLIAQKRLRIQIEAPEAAEKGAEVPVRISASGSRLIGNLRANGRAVNLLCGDEVSLKKLNASGGEIDFSFASPRCGKVKIEVESIEVSDCLNLFRKKIRAGVSASVLVLPETFEIAIESGDQNRPNLESDEYSPVRAGNDPSELFGVRDYREGDALKRIHWKLSEKYDRTVVREASLPVARAILLLLDNCPNASSDPDRACAAVEGLMSASQSLADQGIPHEIAWLNHDTALLEFRTIASLDDLYGEQGAILSSEMIAPRVKGRQSKRQDAQNVVSALLDSDSEAFSRIFLFAAAEPNGFSAIQERATLLLPDENPENALSCLREKLAYLMV